MIDFELKDNTYYLPENWGELTPDQFLFLLDLLNEYAQGKREARSVEINFAMKVLGIKQPKLLSKAQRNRYYENLGFIGEMAGFWWKVVYANPDALKHVDSELKIQLKTILPEDLPDTPEVRVLRREKKALEPDFSFTCNMIPSIMGNGHKYTGYRFGLDETLLSTTLTAGQFADAMTVAGEYGVTKRPQLLNHLCAILYYKYGSDDYNAQHAHTESKQFDNVKSHIKQAVFLNFIGVREYLTMHTQYAILFKRNSSSGKTPAITLGFNDNIYSLVKSGYGDVERLKQFNIITLLDLMIKELKDAVNQMKQMDMDLEKILSSTGLTLAQYKLIAS